MVLLVKVNPFSCSALHVAAHKPYPACTSQIPLVIAQQCERAGTNVLQSEVSLGSAFPDRKVQVCGKVTGLDLKESRRFYMMYDEVVQNEQLNGRSIIKQLIHQSVAPLLEEGDSCE